MIHDHGARGGETRALAVDDATHEAGVLTTSHGVDGLATEDGVLDCLRGIQPEATVYGSSILAVGHFRPLQATAPPTGRDQLRRIRMGVEVPIHDRLGVRTPGTHIGEFTVPHADGNRPSRNASS